MIKMYKLKGAEIFCCKCSETGWNLKQTSVSDCFRLGIEQPYKLTLLVIYNPSPWHHKLFFLSLRKLKNLIMYIKEFMNYADYQNERKIL